MLLRWLPFSAKAEQNVAPIDQEIPGWPSAARARHHAVKVAYHELAQLKHAQQKVTEEEVRTRATAAALKADLSRPLGESRQTFIETYCQIWHEGGVVGALIEVVALFEAQADKCRDAKRRRRVTKRRLCAQARLAALSHVVSGQLAMEAFSPQETDFRSLLTEEQQERLTVYTRAYIRAYQAYRKPRKILGLF